MITAVDTSVILDVITNDPMFASRSEQAVRRARQEGRLVVCDVVLAEVFPALRNEGRLAEFMKDWQMDFSELSYAAAAMAGKLFSDYLHRGGAAKRVVPDFLVGAHAMVAADRLLARDRGYLRDYFRELEVMDPAALE